VQPVAERVETDADTGDAGTEAAGRIVQEDPADSSSDRAPAALTASTAVQRTHLVRGRVTVESGSPREARLELFAGPDLLATTQARQDGSFTLQLPPIELHGSTVLLLVPRHPSLAGRARVLTAGRSFFSTPQDGEVVMVARAFVYLKRPVASLHGEVNEFRGGRIGPADGAEVALFDLQQGEDLRYLPVATGMVVDGRFELVSPTTGELMLVIWGPQHVVQSHLVKLSWGEDLRAGSFELDGQVSLRPRLFGPPEYDLTGVQVEAAVRLDVGSPFLYWKKLRIEGGLVTRTRATGSCNGEGQVELFGLPQRKVALTAVGLAGLGVPARDGLGQVDPTPGRFDIPVNVSRMALRVTDSDSKGLEGARIQVQLDQSSRSTRSTHAEVRTDDEGNGGLFIFSRAEGRLLVQHPDHAPHSSPFSAHRPAVEVQRGIELVRLESGGGVLEVQLADPRTTPRVVVAVRPSGATIAQVHEAEVDPETGIARVEGLPTGGVLVTVMDPAPNSLGLPQQTPVELGSDEPTRLPVHFWPGARVVLQVGAGQKSPLDLLVRSPVRLVESGITSPVGLSELIAGATEQRIHLAEDRSWVTGAALPPASTSFELSKDGVHWTTFSAKLEPGKTHVLAVSAEELRLSGLELSAPGRSGRRR